MTAPIVILFLTALVIGIFVFIAILLTSRSKRTLDKMEYQTDFLAIENDLDRSNKLSYNLCIVEADKLLDKALRELNIPGNTMGERLKKCDRNRFTHLNDVWAAHKLRNQIAHEPRFSVDYTQARRAITIYRQALKDLGAI